MESIEPAQSATVVDPTRSSAVHGNVEQPMEVVDNTEVNDIALNTNRRASFVTLAFLPVNEVLRGFEEIVTAIEAKIAEHAIPVEKATALRGHMKYVENTYIRRVVGRNTLSPLFPIEFWNCFNSVLDNQARTNNAIEGWHRVFNKKFSKRNLNLSHFIIKLKEEEHTTWQLALRHAANPADPLRNPRANKQIIMHRQISKLVTNYVEVEQENRQRLPFLRTLQFHLAKFYTPAADNNPENEGNDESQEEEQ
ncbi:hypothetical protein DdX_15626 [Ditylenchus destructor]|uniref:MULE transposase domain-containing protein n=1 Tax=Ditylenchus destructor TaxID=166010 RepID=A0AAD4MQ00_9BILA|nr:hypothetical protein DdX_15626 [Ditylenchus destructor]